MKLEIYRFELGGKYTEYTIFLNGVLLGANTLDTPAQIEDTDKSTISNILYYLVDDMDEVISRIINQPAGVKHIPCGNCIYSSSNDIVLKELDIKLKMKEIEGDFK